MKDAVSVHCNLLQKGYRATNYNNIYEKLFKEFMNTRSK